MRFPSAAALMAVLAWAIPSACHHLPGNRQLRSIRDNATQHDLQELADKLSPGAEILLPGDDGFDTATLRWSILDPPTISIVVVPSVEEDVAETVKFANKKDIPFLSVNHGHGAVTTVGRLQDGIEIWMNNLNTVDIAEDGKTARVGGGGISKTVVDTLWAAGKQTVTGVCQCTSLLGPGLGGGHGFLQGHHGLVADQFVSMNVVLADGTLHTIDEKSDLWWAMRGAGHNFGIVTSVETKIYDIEHHDWAFQSFVFTGDKIEGLFQILNTDLLHQPVEIITFGVILNDPTVDPDAPITTFFVLQEGVSAVDSTYTAPLFDLGPVASNNGTGPYTDVAVWTGNGNEDVSCQRGGLAKARFPIDLEAYNVDAIRKFYDLFASSTRETPAFNTSSFLYEGYSVQGVQAIPSDSTAYPFRSDNLLVASVITYEPDGPELDEKAAKLGNDLRQILYEGSGRSELHTYVNYAYGDESLQNMYGYEEWRQERLLSLKNKYDPDRKFSFYSPIA